MTFKQKYTENKKLIRNYADVMPLVKKERDLRKLAAELVRLIDQNEIIMAMPVGNYNNNTSMRKETVAQL